MAEAGVGVVTLKPDFSGFSGSALSRGVDPGISGADKHVTGRFRKMFTGIAAMGGGILAGVAVGKFLKSTVEAARESEKITKLTEQTIRSMGGASGYTAG